MLRLSEPNGLRQEQDREANAPLTAGDVADLTLLLLSLLLFLCNAAGLFSLMLH